MDLRPEWDFRHLNEFLTSLHPKFEQRRAQLLARHPRVTLVETLTELSSEETRLRGSGLLSLPSVLVACPPVASTSSSTPPPAPHVTPSPSATSSGGGGHPRPSPSWIEISSTSEGFFLSLDKYI